MLEQDGRFTRMIILVYMALFSSVVSSQEQRLELLWELEGFLNPESVIYDQKRDRLYVSNVDGSAVEKDGKGSISVVSLAGKIDDPAWIIGLHAPKGMAIYGDRLYVADIDRLVEIDINSATVLRNYTVADAKFLNDVTASSDGRIFVSDMMLDRIHVLDQNQFSIWLESAQLTGPNGLQVSGQALVVASWGVLEDGFATKLAGHLKTVDLGSKVISSIGSNRPIGNLDGVEIDTYGHYYVTDWMNGKLLYIKDDGKVELLLDLNQGSADHEYIVDQAIILIPMMQDNTLLAYRLYR